MIKLSRLSAFVAGVLLSAFVLSIGADPARAQQAEAAGTVRTAVETWLKGRYKVDEVRKAPVPGMWEVRLGNDLIFGDQFLGLAHRVERGRVVAPAERRLLPSHLGS